MRSQKGSILVTSALMAIPLIGIAVLSTDVGMAYLVRTESRNAADFASLAAIKRFSKSQESIDFSAIRQAAAVTARQNSTRSNSSIVVDTSEITNPDNPEGDIIFGYYDHDAKTFTGYPDSQLNDPDKIINAIRTRVRIGDGPNQPFTFRFARILGDNLVSNFILVTESIASFAPMKAVFALDQSASMDNRSYKPTDVCTWPALPTTQDRWFHYAATTNVVGDCMNTIEADTVMGPVDDGYVKPQPLWDVTYAIDHSLLDGNRLFNSLVQMGLLVFASNAFAPYSPTDSVELTSTTRNNKGVIQQALRYSVGQWKTYAEADAATRDFRDLPEKLIFPGSVLGGAEERRTHTNIGDAINLAVRWIRNSEQSTRTSNTKFIILLSDGAPTCSRAVAPEDADLDTMPVCPEENSVRDSVQTEVRNMETSLKEQYGDPLPDEYRDFLREYRNTVKHNVEAGYVEMGKAWGVANANWAKANKIVIHSVYFATDEGTCDPDHPAEGYQHLQEVSAITGGSAACAEDLSSLSEIFTNLSTKQTYVLVHVSTT
jgi:hypothetical protein